MVQLARSFLHSLWKRAFRPLAPPVTSNTPSRELRGLFSQLTDDQKKIGLGFQGPTNHGDPAFLVKNQKT